jgi:hypothetical protein
MNEKGFTSNSRDHEYFAAIFKDLIAKGVKPEQIQTIFESKKFDELILKPTMDHASKFVYNAILKNFQQNLELNRMDNRIYDDRRNFLWKEPFELLETLIYISQEIGDEYNSEFRPEAAKNNDLVFEVLIRLHGRACQTALEILVLMQKGFPDGALARWRTLHEIVVYCYFIQKHGQNSAERYLRHEVVQAYGSIKDYLVDKNLYNKHKNTLSEPLVSMREMKQIEKMRDKLCITYEGSFKNDYGWTSDIIKEGNPTFLKIEKEVHLDHLHPYYKMANIPVHAGSKGIKFYLSSPDSNHNIPAGPSNLGMSEPGQLTAISLLQLNTLLLTTKPCIKHFADITSLQKLERKTTRSFAKVHKKTMRVYHDLMKENVS